MGIVMDEFRKAREQAKASYGRGADYLRLAEGHTALYLCPPGPGMGGVPYVVADVHYGIGRQNGSALCLDAGNPVFSSPLLRKYLAARKDKVVPGKCPVCEILESDAPEGYSDPDGEQRLQRMARKRQWLHVAIPWGQISGGQLRETSDGERTPRILSAGWTIWNAICDVIDLHGDITDPDAACLVVITRDGMGLTTKYAVSAYRETVIKPLRLQKPQRFALKKGQAEGGELDLFRVVAAMAKPAEAVETMLRGGQVGVHAVGEGKPACFGLVSEYIADDPDCQACDHHDECAAVVGDGGGEKKAKAETSKTKATRRGELRKKAKPEPEPEEVEADEAVDSGSEEEEEDDIPDFSAKSMGVSKRAAGVTVLEGLDDFDRQLKKHRAAREKADQ